MSYQSTETRYATTESAFKADSTPSNMCGVTLMNNQIGSVVAEVMSSKEGVTITRLPSMIRVDCTNRMDFVYDEISEALGEGEGFYDAAGAMQQVNTEFPSLNHFDKVLPEDPQGYGRRVDQILVYGAPGSNRFVQVVKQTNPARNSDHNMVYADIVLPTV